MRADFTLGLNFLPHWHLPKQPSCKMHLQAIKEGSLNWCTKLTTFILFGRKHFFRMRACESISSAKSYARVLIKFCEKSFTKWKFNTYYTRRDLFCTTSSMRVLYYNFLIKNIKISFDFYQRFASARTLFAITLLQIVGQQRSPERPGECILRTTFRWNNALGQWRFGSWFVA